MNQAVRRYVAVEAAVGAVINGLLSLAFCFLLFGGQSHVPVGGTGGLILDAVPQGVMIALMSAVVPTLITHRRLARGGLPGLVDEPPSRRNGLRRALLIAGAAASLSFLINAAFLSIGPSVWPFGTVAIAKTLYGALLGAIVSAVATRAACSTSEPPTPVRPE